MLNSLDDRDGLIWLDGELLPWREARLHVLTHAWMLEQRGDDPWVVVAMSNSDGGGIDAYQVQSVTNRILELVAESR